MVGDGEAGHPRKCRSERHFCYSLREHAGQRKPRYFMTSINDNFSPEPSFIDYSTSTNGSVSTPYPGTPYPRASLRSESLTTQGEHHGKEEC